jgi:ssDNA-binding Zn-finger/Zn-ribbon topoisomerase 1
MDSLTCPYCRIGLVYRPGRNGGPAFFACPQYKKHMDRPVLIRAEDVPAPATAKPQTFGRKD